MSAFVPGAKLDLSHASASPSARGVGRTGQPWHGLQWQMLAS